MPSSRKVLVGVFLAGGLILFSFGLFWIGDRRHFFTDSMELYTEFFNVSGLTRGSKVRVAGMDAGEVVEIRMPPDPDSRFVVRFRVISDFQPILRLDSTTSIQTDGLVGSKFLQVDAGTAQAPPAEPGSRIPGREPTEITDLLDQAGGTIELANEAILDIREGIDGTVKAVLGLHREAVELINETGEEIHTITAYGARLTEDITELVAGVKRGEGTVGRLVTDDVLYDQLLAGAREAETTIRNLRQVSGDFREVSADLKAQEVGTRVGQVTQSLDDLLQEATDAIRSLQEGESGGLMAEVRETLGHANEAMANFADNSEALKRNFFFRGFFNQRGFFDLDAVSVDEYQERRFLADHRRIEEWVEAADVFEVGSDGVERLTEEGKRHLDLHMARFLNFSRREPLVIESWAGHGTPRERVVKARDRGLLVRDYLVERFELRSNYVTALAMNTVDNGGKPDRDGLNLVLFVPRGRR